MNSNNKTLDDIILHPAYEFIEGEPRIQYSGNSVINTLLITEPDNCIINETNQSYDQFKDAGITPILYAASKVEPNKWISCTTTASLAALREKSVDLIDPLQIYLSYPSDSPIEVANIIKVLKGLGNIIMVDNVISPAIFDLYAAAGADYCIVRDRLNDCCPVSYEMGSLILNIWNSKQANKHKTGIIAAGIDDISQCIKALALGADHIMMFEPMLQCFESSARLDRDHYTATVYSNSAYNWLKASAVATGGGGVYVEDDDVYQSYPDEHIKSTILRANSDIIKKYEPDFKLSDSSKLYARHNHPMDIPVKYTALQLSKTFHAYLRQTMIYCGCKELSDFIGYVPKSSSYWR